MQWKEDGKFFDWEGRRVFYRSAGQGPYMLLIHGYPVSSYDWHRVWADLSMHFTLIAPDMLGMGFSDKPADFDYTIAHHAQMHLALLRHLQVWQTLVVAHDLESRATPAPNRMPDITDITFLNGGLCPEAYKPRWIQRLLASPAGAWLGPRVSQATFEKTISKLFGAQTPPGAELLTDFWTLYEHGGGRLMNHRVGRFWRDRQKQRERLVNATLNSNIPMRLINGADDPNSGWHMAMAFMRIKPDARVIKLDGIGHWPQIEKSSEVAYAIRAHASVGLTA